MFKRKRPTFYLERDNKKNFKKKNVDFARAYSFTTQTNFNSQMLKRYLMHQAHLRVLLDPVFNTIHFIQWESHFSNIAKDMAKHIKLPY